MNTSLQLAFSNSYTWMKLLYFDAHFNAICSQWWNWWYTITGWDNGLALNMQQVIICTNDGIVYWCIYVSVCLDVEYRSTVIQGKKPLLLITYDIIRPLLVNDLKHHNAHGTTEWWMNCAARPPRGTMLIINYKYFFMVRCPVQLINVILPVKNSHYENIKVVLL